MLNNITFLNFQSTFKSPIQKQNKINSNFNVTAPKLMPLQQDTVSFTGSVQEVKTALVDPEICDQLHEDASPVTDFVRELLETYFSNDLYNKSTNPNGIIAALKARAKTGDSIGDKISGKIKDAHEEKSEKNFEKKIFHTQSKPAIKRNIRDISGGRIVIRKTQGDEVDKIVENLCKMIKDKNLIIDEIENHISPDKEAKPYFTRAQLTRLLSTANMVRKKNELKPIEIATNKTPSGYMALHLSVDTRTRSEIGDNIQNKNFWSEIQILGSDVELLKDVEDLCYKLKRGMSIYSGHPAYAPFEKAFKDAYFSSPEVEKAFQKYTVKAYTFQRNRSTERAVLDDVKNWGYQFPTIKECGLEGKVPPTLDFNVLARLKRDCDDIYHVMQEPEKYINDTTLDSTISQS